MKFAFARSIIIFEANMKHKEEFEFSYKGGNSIDVNTLLTSQFHFLAALNELQKELFPQGKLNLRISAFKEGSFIVQFILETSFLQEIFTKDNAKFAFEILAAFSTVVTIHQALGGKKAKEVTDNGSTVEINIRGDGNSINIDRKIFDIYKHNPTLSNAITSNFDLLEKDKSIEGIEIKESTAKEAILSVPESEFENLSKINPYLDRETTEEIYREERLFIKKPNLLPEKNKVWRWEVIHKGNDIAVKITDKDFERQINDGLRIGQGDSLVVDLKILYRWNEKFNTYVQTGKYEAIKVHRVIERNEQTTFRF